MTNSNYPFINPGVLEVYCGPVKSGKTRELINRVDKLTYLPNCIFDFFKPSVDTRDDTIKSRFGSLSYKCKFVDEKDPNKILSLSDKNADLIVIDECQFFAPGIEDILEKLQKSGVNVVVGGLELDFRGEPFGQMPNILARANIVHKLVGVCEYDGCGRPGTRTQRLNGGEPVHYNAPLIVIDDKKGSYQCRCNTHHIVPGKP